MANNDRFNVYRQADPINTGEPLPKPSYGTWHRANFIKVGTANSMAEAKQLTAAPVLEPRA